MFLFNQSYRRQPPSSTLSPNIPTDSTSLSPPTTTGLSRKRRRKSSSPIIITSAQSDSSHKRFSPPPEEPLKYGELVVVDYKEKKTVYQWPAIVLLPPSKEKQGLR